MFFSIRYNKNLKVGYFWSLSLTHTLKGNCNSYYRSNTSLTYILGLIIVSQSRSSLIKKIGKEEQFI